MVDEAWAYPVAVVVRPAMYGRIVIQAEFRDGTRWPVRLPGTVQCLGLANPDYVLRWLRENPQAFQR